MKKLSIYTFIALLFSTHWGMSQIEGTNGFMFSDFLEIGIHDGGFEGSSVRPTFPDHWRGGPSRIGFMANPLEDGWINYDGDFYLPGSPQNDFGIQIDGVDYKNGSVGTSDIPVTLGVHDYEIVGRCKKIEWDGSVAGIDIHILYKMDTTVSYYTVDVTLTNTNPVPKANVYCYKTFDPDNNQYIGWTFTTQNQVDFEPDPFCPKSLVHAAQYNAWTSYVGLAAVDPNTRVSRGDFSCWGACGSNIYNAVAPHVGVEEAVEFAADQAISICHKDALLGAGESSNFQFVVILDEDQVEEAILSLYFVDYDGSPGALASCTEELIDVDGDGDLEPVPDTVDFDCTGGSIDLSFDGPYVSGYDITWYNEDLGIEIGTGTEIAVDPIGTTMYRVVAEPVGDCFELDIERYIVVRGIGIGPDIEIADIGPQCSDVPLSDLTITDLMDLPDTFIEFYSEVPDSMDDPADIWPGGPIGPDDEVYVLIGHPAGGCYDIELIEIDFITIDAGLDSTGFALCNSGVETITDISTFLVDTILVAGAGMWEEVTPTWGAFDPVAGTFDPTGMAAGDYVLRFIALGGAVCDNDTSLHTISVFDQPESGLDNVGDICNEAGFAIDLNTLLSGHDIGGFWEETTPTGGAFNPMTGVFTMDGMLAPGLYTFEYILLATDPCINDTSRFEITVNALPPVDAGADQSICIGDETLVTATSSPGATIVWDPAGISDGVPFTPAVGTVTYTATATDVNGCVNSDQMDIVVHALPVISFTADTLQGCTDFPVEFTINSDVAIATTDWTFGDGDVAMGTTLPNVPHTYTFQGLFDVSATVTDIYGCVSTVEYNDYITVETQPVAAFTFNPQSVFTNDTEVDFTNESLHATDYLWDFGDGQPMSNEMNPTHFFPDQDGDVYYTVEMKASNYLGCVDSAYGFVLVKDIILFYIPNTFTPDGDQYNETFQPVFESGYDPFDYHLVIFNRWGEIVYESYNAAVGWDGTYGNGDLAENGVYTWQIDFKEKNSDARHVERGHVTLLR